jgi:uncharacterized protein
VGDSLLVAMSLIGIDLGSRWAGTTAVAILHEGRVSIHQSEKGKDADAFLSQVIQEYAPAIVAMDAPLSLPGVYRGLEGFSDYHYRRCDKQCSAMSPMFLGGLTARAIQLAERWKTEGILVVESYPKMQAERLGLSEPGYKKTLEAIEPIRQKLEDEIQFSIPTLNNWHQTDAVLALIGAWRFSENKHISYGVDHEGLIII